METIATQQLERIWQLADEWVSAGFMSYAKTTHLYRLCKIHGLDIAEVVETVRES